MAAPPSPPVIVTRPRAQAEALARQVALLGCRAEIFPLLDIQPLPDQGPLRAALAQLPDYALLVFVSPNAIDAALAVLDTWPDGLTIGVVGEGSRRALERHGITSANARIVQPRDPRRQDSEGLLQALDLEALRGGKALLVRGESGRELLSDALRAAGVAVTQVAAYRRAAPPLDAPRLRQLLDVGGDWIITSSEALRIFRQLAAQAGGGAAVAKMQQQHLIVPHARIAETASSLGFTDVTLTASGDAALLAALQSGA